jgi:hypothetical protein
MSLCTLIGRVTDGMPLVGNSESTAEMLEFTKKGKDILKTLRHDSPARCSIKADKFLFQYACLFVLKFKTHLVFVAISLKKMSAISQLLRNHIRNNWPSNF